MKKSLLVIALNIFLLTCATAIACDCGNDESGLSFIGNASFRDRTVHALDHTNSPEEGNWIILNPQNDDRVIKVPKPLKFTYSGPKSIEYGQASAALNKNEDEPYIVEYPASADYQYWPVYLPGENVKMSFFGQSALKEQPVEIYLLNANTEPARKLLDAYRAKETQNLSKLFHDSMDGNYQKYQANLDRKGNLEYDLGPLDAGQYGILMLKHEEDGCITIVSGTGFIVSEYELSISSPEAIKEGEDLDITLGLKNAPQGLDCTYAALLIKDDAYRVDVNLDSDGTKNGTYLKVNDLDPFEVIGINPKEIDINPQEINASSINDPKYSEYKAKIREKANREEVQKALLKFIGEGKGSIAMGQNGQKDLSLTAFDLPKGQYYLCVAAYTPGIGI
ncbi:MAG: TIGR04279 domain-containing protein, partial [Methanosarcina sp.]